MNGPCGHRVKQPPCTSEFKIASFACKFQFVINKANCGHHEFLILRYAKAKTVLFHRKVRRQETARTRCAKTLLQYCIAVAKNVFNAM